MSIIDQVRGLNPPPREPCVYSHLRSIFSDVMVTYLNDFGEAVQDECLSVEDIAELFHEALTEELG